MVVNPGGDRSGGAERSMKLLIRDIVKRGHQVGVVTLKEGDAANSFESQGSEVLANGLQCALDKSQRHGSTCSFLSGALLMLPRGIEVASEIRAIGTAFEADVIHSNGLRTHVLTPLMGRFPVVWSLRERPPKKFLQLLVKETSRWAAAVIAPSYFASELVVGCRCPTYVISNPIEPSDPSYSEVNEARRKLGLPLDRQIVGVVAHFHPTKGHHLVVDAWRHLGSPRPLLVLAGGDLYGSASVQYRDKLSSSIRNAGLENDVMLPGVIDDMATFYAACDLLVHPAIHPEGFGRSVAEAQLAGVPVIASDLGATPELVISDETGILVPPGNSRVISNEVTRLLSDPSILNRLRLGGLRAAPRYSPDQHAKAVESVYLSVVR